MKITEAKIYQVHAGHHRFALLKLITDEKIEGIGEASLSYGYSSTAAVGMIKELVEKFILGKDPFRIESLCHDMYSHSFWGKGGGCVFWAGLSAIEIALWDIKGKALNLPIYEMLGGKTRDSVRCYANGWSFNINTPEEQAEKAKEVVTGGYDAIKMYPLALASSSDKGSATLKHVSERNMTRKMEELAVARVEAVREAVGPKIDIMVDVSAELTTDGIIRLGQKLEKYDLLFFEEVVDPYNLEAQKKVSEKVNIPIAAGERHYSRYGFRQMLELQAVDVLQPSLGTSGGIMEVKKIAAMAETYNLRIAPHLCASPIATAATAQLDACITNFYIQEVYPFRIEDHFNIVDHALELDIRDGLLEIPDKPGLGVILNDERVEQSLWAHCKT